MMRSSEGTGVLTRFGALRRRMSMRRTVTTIVFCLAALVTPGRLWRKSEVPKLLHSQPACAAGSASLQKRRTRVWQSVNSAPPPTCVREPLCTNHLQNKSAFMPTIAGRLTLVSS